MTEWSIKVEITLAKRRIKVEKFQLFIWNSCILQNLITKIKILTYHENVFFSEYFFFEKLNI